MCQPEHSETRKRQRPWTSEEKLLHQAESSSDRHDRVYIAAQLDGRSGKQWHQCYSPLQQDGTPGPWTKDEDETCLQAEVGNNWSEIAKHLPSIKCVKNRWQCALHPLRPAFAAAPSGDSNPPSPESAPVAADPMPKPSSDKPPPPRQPKAHIVPWTPADDQALLAAVRGRNAGGARRGRNWSRIAEGVAGRTARQCWQRYRHHLQEAYHAGGWTAEEDAAIVAHQARAGNSWSAVARLLPGRSANAVKNRWHSTLCPRPRSAMAGGIGRRGAARRGRRKAGGLGVASDAATDMWGMAEHKIPEDSEGNRQCRGPDSSNSDSDASFTCHTRPRSPAPPSTEQGYTCPGPRCASASSGKSGAVALGTFQNGGDGGCGCGWGGRVDSLWEKVQDGGCDGTGGGGSVPWPRFSYDWPDPFGGGGGGGGEAFPDADWIADFVAAGGGETDDDAPSPAPRGWPGLGVQPAGEPGPPQEREPGWGMEPGRGTGCSTLGTGRQMTAGRRKRRRVRDEAAAPAVTDGFRMAEVRVASEASAHGGGGGKGGGEGVGRWGVGVVTSPGSPARHARHVRLLRALLDTGRHDPLPAAPARSASVAAAGGAALGPAPMSPKTRPAPPPRYPSMQEMLPTPPPTQPSWRLFTAHPRPPPTPPPPPPQLTLQPRRRGRPPKSGGPPRAGGVCGGRAGEGPVSGPPGSCGPTGRLGPLGSW